MDAEPDVNPTVVNTTHIPIAHLNPLLPAASTISIKAIVTLIWPYSSSHKSLKILLAEPDFRLRRSQGQVRVHFSGSSASQVYEAGIGSGDEVILSLDGVAWVRDDALSQTPGRGIEWELKFTEKLMIQIIESETGRVSFLKIDHPSPEPEESQISEISSPRRIPSPHAVSITPIRQVLFNSEKDEWSSPAFIKRARVSYGSLLEPGYDMFDDDDGMTKGNPTKRVKFGPKSGGWRYNSRSPSPQAASIEDIRSAGASLQSETEVGLEPDGDAHMSPDGQSRQEVGAVGETKSHQDQQTTTGQLQLMSPGRKPTKQPSSLLMAPPPPNVRPAMIIDTHNTQEVEDNDTESTANPPFSPRLEPVSAHALPLVSPLISSELNPFHQQAAASSVDVIEGSSWQNQSGPQNGNISSQWDVAPGVGLHMLHPPGPSDEIDTSRFEVTQADSTPYVEAPLDPADQPDYWQNAEAANDQLTGFTSPQKPEGDWMQRYPELDTQNDLQKHDKGHSPYYNATVIPSHTGLAGKDLPNSHDSENERLGSGQFVPSWNLTNEQSIDHQRTIRSNSVEQHENSFANVFLPTASATVSAPHTQSIRPDPLAVSEDSEEERYDSVEDAEMENVESGGRRRYPDQVPGDEADLEDAEGEDESFDEEEYSEEEFDDEHTEIKYPPGFRPGYELTGTGSDEEVEGEVFDEEDLSEEESPSPPNILPAQREPVIIDLLSSDEEDAAESEEDTHELDGSNDGSNDSAGGEHDSDDISDEELAVITAQSLSRSDIGQSDDYEQFGGDSVGPLGSVLVQSDKDREVPMRTMPIGLEARKSEPSADNDEVLEKTGRVTADTREDLASHDIYGVDHQNSAEQSAADGLVGPHDGRHLKDLLHPDPAGMQTVTAGEVVYPVLPQIDIETTDGTRTSLSPTRDNNTLLLQENASFSVHQLPTPEATQLIAIPGDVSFSGSTQHSPSSAPRTQNLPPDQPISPPARKTSPPEGVDTVKADDNSKHSRPRPFHLEFHPITPAKSGSVATTKDHTRTEPETPRSGDTQLSSSAAGLEEPTSPDSHDASAELALASLDSPTKSSTPRPTIASLRLKLARPLHTDLGEFTPLKLLRHNLNKKLDIIAIAVSAPSSPQRASHAPKHFHIRFSVSDPSTLGTVTEIQIFRPAAQALPTVHVGDAVLLRHFQVKAEKGRGFALRSDEGSAWVVFSGQQARRDDTAAAGAAVNEEIAGPPVEFGDGERNHVLLYFDWFAGLDDLARTKLDRAVSKVK